ncbi:histidine phosphatase family protein [Ferrovibrio sp.]|uniref:histidine phosphatase family protein n=1 Tax=Ferrovibrio sp. TaxID=1917215 RepID=UPI002628C4C1|nr:histidine phosphatase family protein [Ferrovibrio sp.]
MRILLQGIAIVLLACVVLPAQANENLWQALREGRAVALMRHAVAPGTGDPPGFRLDDCATQRNLSAEGHAQARRVGAAFRGNGITAAVVKSSAWCRARDTATGLGLGSAETAASLNSFFGDASRAPAQTAALRELIAALPPGRPAVLVTHQVVITAMTGLYPQSGEMVVLARDGLAVLGRLPAG